MVNPKYPMTSEVLDSLISTEYQKAKGILIVSSPSKGMYSDLPSLLLTRYSLRTGTNSIAPEDIEDFRKRYDFYEAETDIEKKSYEKYYCFKKTAVGYIMGTLLTEVARLGYVEPPQRDKAIALSTEMNELQTKFFHEVNFLDQTTYKNIVAEEYQHYLIGKAKERNRN